MIHFYVDIEGTLIDNLFDCNYLPHNCENIKEYIHRHDSGPYVVDLFTWGWVEQSEIDRGIVHNLFNRLEILPAKRGSVIVKADSVKKFVERAISCYDPEELKKPGGFGKHGYTKPAIWGFTACVEQEISVLIDDTVTETEQACSGRGQVYINPARMKVVIRNNAARQYTLYTPDHQEVGKILSHEAMLDVRIQVRAQALKGYYVVDGHGDRFELDEKGNVWGTADSQSYLAEPTLFMSQSKCMDAFRENNLPTYIKTATLYAKQEDDDGEEK
jgi:hypothetical protein